MMKRRSFSASAWPEPRDGKPAPQEKSDAARGSQCPAKLPGSRRPLLEA